jgi:hypothetical protein
MGLESIDAILAKVGRAPIARVAPVTYTIPAGPSPGTLATGGAANTLGAWQEMSASVGADSWIYAVSVHPPGTVVRYVRVEIGIGAATAEATWAVVHVALHSTASDGDTQVLPVWVPVAAGQRLACRVADNVGALAHNLVLHAITRANVE